MIELGQFVFCTINEFKSVKPSKSLTYAFIDSTIHVHHANIPQGMSRKNMASRVNTMISTEIGMSTAMPTLAYMQVGVRVEIHSIPALPFAMLKKSTTTTAGMVFKCHALDSIEHSARGAFYIVDTKDPAGTIAVYFFLEGEHKLSRYLNPQNKGEFEQEIIATLTQAERQSKSTSIRIWTLGFEESDVAFLEEREQKRFEGEKPKLADREAYLTRSRSIAYKPVLLLAASVAFASMLGFFLYDSYGLSRAMMESETALKKKMRIATAHDAATIEKNVFDKYSPIVSWEEAYGEIHRFVVPDQCMATVSEYEFERSRGLRVSMQIWGHDRSSLDLRVLECTTALGAGLEVSGETEESGPWFFKRAVITREIGHASTLGNNRWFAENDGLGGGSAGGYGRPVRGENLHGFEPPDLRRGNQEGQGRIQKEGRGVEGIATEILEALFDQLVPSAYGSEIDGAGKMDGAGKGNAGNPGAPDRAGSDDGMAKGGFAKPSRYGSPQLPAQHGDSPAEDQPSRNISKGSVSGSSNEPMTLDGIAKNPNAENKFLKAAIGDLQEKLNKTEKDLEEAKRLEEARKAQALKQASQDTQKEEKKVYHDAFGFRIVSMTANKVFMIGDDGWTTAIDMGGVLMLDDEPYKLENIQFDRAASFRHVEKTNRQAIFYMRHYGTRQTPAVSKSTNTEGKGSSQPKPPVKAKAPEVKAVVQGPPNPGLLSASPQSQQFSANEMPQQPLTPGILQAGVNMLLNSTKLPQLPGVPPSVMQGGKK